MRSILLFASLVFSLLLAELAVRISCEFSPQVRYLATAGYSGSQPIAHTLEEFLKRFAPFLEPRRAFNGYPSNNYGFCDQDFVEEKTPGRLRIAVLGDSFTYGSVPYPSTVTTLLETHLKEACKSKDLELYNFGIPGASVWDYQMFLPFVIERFHPDVVLINFYLGNDGPDLVYNNVPGPLQKRKALHSFLYALVRNLIILKRSNMESGTPKLTQDLTSTSPDQIAIASSDKDPPYNQPGMETNAWLIAMRDELFRLYKFPGVKQSRSWRELEGQLLEMVDQCKTAHVDFIVTMYPSRLQFDAKLRAKVIQLNQEVLDKKNINSKNFIADLPEKLLFKFCKEHALQCGSLSSAFASQADPTDYYRAQDTHWNFAGNALAAKEQAKLVTPWICGDKGDR